MIQLLKKIAFSGLVFSILLIPLLSVHGLGGGAGGPPNATNNSTGSGGPTTNSVSITIANPLSDTSADSIPKVLQIVFSNIVLPIGAVVAVLYIMYAGFMMVTAQGNPAKIKEARAAFFNAAIGTAILLGAWAISQAIANTINTIVAP